MKFKYRERSTDQACDRKSIRKYTEEIAKYSLLSTKDEIDLARRIREGDKQALETLVKANLRIVVAIAKQYQGYGLPLPDLISEGNLGLLKAAERFDPSRGFKFISYAVWWIRQCMLLALAEQSRIVRLPVYRLATVRKYGRVLGELEKRFEREPSIEEIAESVEMTTEQVSALEMEMASARHISLDTPYADNENTSLLDVLKSDRHPAPDVPLLQESLRSEISSMISNLPPREAEIIRMYFGFHGTEAHTLEQIAKRFNVTIEFVRQIKQRALRRLHRRSLLDRLQEYVAYSPKGEYAA